MKIGIIGISEGNGHPYSWSAIFNGYNPEAMENCGFPVIPRYLEQQSWPHSCIPNAEVTCVWTQDRELSKKIAQASLIQNVTEHPEDMLGQIDALLLARDDAENHLKFAEPFLKAGIPIYIDKPIALSMKGLRQLYSLERYSGQIFTCSALRFAKELQLSDGDRAEIGDICQVIACTPKSWDKYAVHIIEPVINMLPADDQTDHFIRLGSKRGGSESTLSVGWRSGVQTVFFATGHAVSPISIRVIGTKGWRELVFKDSFSAFKSALESFMLGVNQGTIESPRDFNEKVVTILEKGRP